MRKIFKKLSKRNLKSDNYTLLMKSVRKNDSNECDLEEEERPEHFGWLFLKRCNDMQRHHIINEADDLMKIEQLKRDTLDLSLIKDYEHIQAKQNKHSQSRRNAVCQIDELESEGLFLVLKQYLQFKYILRQGIFWAR